MMNKIKILFTINNLNVGGAEKALISLLNEIDYSKFEVDLQLFTHSGLFLSDLPSQVNLLEVPKNYHFFDGSYLKVLNSLNPILIYNRFKFTRVKKKSENPVEREQLSWKYLSRAFKTLEKEYDVAIGYLENTPIYFTVDKVKAKTKIGFIHNDYKNIHLNKELDEPYFKKLNYICSVSDHCVDILKEVFPQYTNKIKLIPNLFSENLILNKSKEPLTEISIENDYYNIVSVGRLAEQKGFDLAIQAANILKNNGFKFKWFILGEGPLRAQLESLIIELDLKDNFFLLGNTNNPYKFIHHADLIVQSSRFEGKSIAIDEAKLLNKLILVTNYPTVKDQITHKVDGYICELNPQSLAESIIDIENNSFVNQKIKQYLLSHPQKVENKILELF